MIELENCELKFKCRFIVECRRALLDQVGLVTKRKF